MVKTQLYHFSLCDIDIVCGQSLESCLTFCTLWTVAHQAPLSMGILQTRILGWVAMPSFRGSSCPRIKPASLMCPALAGRFFTFSATWKAQCRHIPIHINICHYSTKLAEIDVHIPMAQEERKRLREKEAGVVVVDEAF